MCGLPGGSSSRNKELFNQGSRPRAPPPPTLPLHCTTNETMAEYEDGSLKATGISEDEVVALATLGAEPGASPRRRWPPS